MFSKLPADKKTKYNNVKEYVTAIYKWHNNCLFIWDITIYY